MARNEFGILKSELAATLHDTSLLNRCGDWLNETVKDIHRRTNFSYLQIASTLLSVASQIEYDFSDIVGVSSNDLVDKILAIRDQENGINLVYVSYSSLYDFEPDPENQGTGVPTVFYTKNRLIGLVPTPRDILTYQIDYKKRPVDMSSDTDTPDLPMEWVDVIKTGAEARGLRYQKRSDWPAVHQLYEQMVTSYIGDTQVKGRQEYQFQKIFTSPGIQTPRIKV